MHAAEALLRLATPSSRASTCPRSRKAKVVDLGPHIVLDRSAASCARAASASATRSPASHQLEMAHRGDHEVLDHRAGPAARQPLLAQHRRRLPGRRADRQGLPLRDAGLGAARDAVGLPGLRHRLQHRGPPLARARSYRLVPRAQPGRQQALDVRRGPLHLQARCATSAWSAPMSAGCRSTGTARWTTRRARCRRSLATRPRHGRRRASTRSPPTRTTTRWRGWRSTPGSVEQRRTWRGRRPGLSAPTTSCVDADKNPNTARRRRRSAAGRLRSLLRSRRNDLQAGALTALLVARRRRRARSGRGRRRCPSTARGAGRRRRARDGRRHRRARTSRCRSRRGPRSTARSPTAQGMVQRMRAAVPPAGEALPGWEILSHAGAQASGAAHGLRRGARQVVRRHGQAEARRLHEGRRLGPPMRARCSSASPTREGDAMDLQLRPHTAQRSSTALSRDRRPQDRLFLVLGFVMPLASLLTWMERRQSAMMQDRLGPNRANIGPDPPHGASSTSSPTR